MTVIQILEQLQLASLRKVSELHGESFNPDFYDQRKKIDRIISDIRERDNDEEYDYYKKFSENYPEEFASDTESDVKYFEHLFSEMPTGLQDPISYFNMQEILNKVIAIYNSHFSQGKELKIPVFGSTQIGAFSSFIIPVGNESLLVYSDAFFHFSHLICRIIAMTMTGEEITERGTVKFNLGNSYNHVLNDKKLQMRFLDLMFAQIIYSEPFEAETIGDISFGQKQIAMRIKEAFVAFIMSHEFAHYANGDLITNQNKTENRAAYFTKSQESQADDLAVKLTNMFVAQENNLVNHEFTKKFIADIGILCAFCSLNLVEKVEQLKSGYSTNLDTLDNNHPPVNERIKSVLAIYPDESERELAMWYLEDLINVFGFLWERFLRYYNFISDNCQSIFGTMKVNQVQHKMLEIAIYNEKLFDMAMGSVPFETRVFIDLMLSEMTYPFLVDDMDMFAISNFAIEDDIGSEEENTKVIEIGDFDEELRSVKSSFGINNLPVNPKFHPRIAREDDLDKITRPVAFVRNDEGRTIIFDVLAVVELDGKQFEVLSDTNIHSNKRESNKLFVIENKNGKFFSINDKCLIGEIFELVKNENPQFDIFTKSYSEMVDTASNNEATDDDYLTLDLIEKDTGAPFRVDIFNDEEASKQNVFNEESMKSDYPEIFSLNFDVGSIADEDLAIKYSKTLRMKCFVATTEESVQMILSEYATLLEYFPSQLIKLDYTYALWYGFQNDNNWQGFKDSIVERAVVIVNEVDADIPLYLEIVAVTAKLLNCYISHLCNNTATGRVGIHEVILQKFDNQSQRFKISEDDVQKIRIRYEQFIELANSIDKYEEIDDGGNIYIVQYHLIESSLDIFSTLDDAHLLENTGKFVFDCLCGRKGKPYFEHADCLFTKKEVALLADSISIAFMAYNYSFQQDDILAGVQKTVNKIPDLMNPEVTNAMAEFLEDNTSTSFSHKIFSEMPFEFIDKIDEIHTNNRVWDPTRNTGKEMLTLPMMINKSREAIKFHRVIGSTQDFLGVPVGTFISLGYSIAVYLGRVEISEFNTLQGDSKEYIPIGQYIVLWLLQDEVLWEYCLKPESPKSILSYFTKENLLELHPFKVFVEDEHEIIDMVQIVRTRLNIIEKCLPTIIEIMSKNALENGNMTDFEDCRDCDDNNQTEGIQILELSNGDKSSKFIVLDTICIKRKKYLCVTPYSDSDIEKADSISFIIMEEKENVNGGKSLMPIKKGRLAKKILSLFKKRNKDRYNFE